MKPLCQFFLILLLLGFLITDIIAQVGINTDASSPDPSAMLDVKSTTKGMLVPRTSSSQRTAISTPATGLLVFDTDTNSFWYYNGSSWLNISKIPSQLADVDNDTKIQVEETTDDDIIRFDVGNYERMKLIKNASHEARLEFTNPSHTFGIGAGSLENNQAGGTYNTAVGDSTLNSNTTGDYNTAIGYKSLYSNTTGDNNTTNGYQSLYSNTTGNYNTANGFQSLYNNIEGGYNTANGHQSLYSNTTGDYNTAFGRGALSGNKANSRSTAVGYLAMYYAHNTTDGDSTYNTAIGAQALRGSINAANNTGKYNTALGDAAMYINTSGSRNIAIGVQALYSNTSGEGNIAIGNGTLRSNTTRDGLVAIGDSSLYACTAVINTAVGFKALRYTTTGRNNTAIGPESLYNNTTGNYNSANGSGALFSNTEGDYNTANGYLSLYYNTTGGTNTAIGESALYANTEGDFNTANGYRALYQNSTGAFNTGLGYWSDVSVNNLSRATALGYYALVNASDKVVIGSNTAGIVIGGYSAWSNLSDGRFKENVTENVPGLSFITQLKPVTYTVNNRKLDEHIMHQMPDSVRVKRMQSDADYSKAQSIIHTGFVAQEVEAIAKQLNYSFDGVNSPQNPTDNYSISYSQFVMPLVKAVQEQQAMIEKQNKQINILKEELMELKSLLK